MTMIRRRNSDSIGSSVDLSPWCVLKLTHQGGSTGVLRYAVCAEHANSHNGEKTTVHDTHSCTQPSLVPKQVGLDLSCRNTG